MGSRRGGMRSAALWGLQWVGEKKGDPGSAEPRMQPPGVPLVPPLCYRVQQEEVGAPLTVFQSTPPL